MSLTRITSSVISSNVITSDLLQNSIIQARHIQPGSLTTDLLVASGNAAAVEIRVNANLDIVQDNVAALVTGLDGANTNIDTVQGNVYTDFTTLTGLIDVVQDNVVFAESNVSAVETRRDTNTIIFTDAFTGTNAAVTAITDGSTEFSVNKIFQQNVIIQGNLIVVGSQVDLGVGTATIDDNFIVVSANLTGTPATDSGIIVNRGSEGNVFIGDHIEEDGVVFALSQSPHDNATISIQEYLDVHGNAFHANSGLNFSRVHFGHQDDESTGIIADTTNNHIKFIIGGTEVANIDAQANLALNDGRLTGNPNADGDRNAIDLDVDEEADVINSVSIESVNSIFFLIDKNDNGDNPNAYIGVFNDVADLSASTRETAIFSIRDNGEVFANSVSMAFDANIAGVGVMANDYVTYTRLNANLNSTTDNINTITDNVNVVQDNVAALTGGATILVPFTNVNTALGTSNVFFIGQDCANDSNVLVVTLDGIRQHPTLDWIGNYSNDTVQFVDDSIPSGTIVSITSLAAP
jgi:hypothetical protein